MLWNRKSQAPRCAGESTQVFLYEPLSQQEHRGANIEPQKLITS